MKPGFRFSAHSRDMETERRNSHVPRGITHHRGHKNQSLTWQDRASSRRSQQSRERSRHYEERNPRGLDNLHGPPKKSYYREIPKQNLEPRDTGSSATKSFQDIPCRGDPHRAEQVLIQKNLELEAR